MSAKNRPTIVVLLSLLLVFSGPAFALPPGNFTSFTDTGSQLIFAAQAAHYQDPFLASITPPAEHYS